MIALALVALQQAAAIHGRTVDAGSGTPVRGAAVIAPASRAVSDDAGRFVVAARPGDTLRVMRVGYRARLVVADTGEVVISLQPVALRLTGVDVHARAASAGRLVAAREVTEARGEGALETADVVAHLPFVTARSGPGGAALSMRGSRPEQVLVMIDGLPLNDPATGTADLSDVPLAALRSVSATPGADAAAWGSGASGGVIQLSPGSGSVLSASAASFGERAIEGAASAAIGGWHLRAGGAAGRARNDFPFTVDRSLSGLPDSTAERDDADEHRLALFAGAASPAAQLWVFGSGVERGLARPVGANTARMREARRRLMARAQGALGGVLIAGGARYLSVDYHDPRGVASGSTARVLALDADVAREVGRLTLRAGAGVDRAEATKLAEHLRPRGFGSAALRGSGGPVQLEAALRFDALRGGGSHLSPSLAAEWPVLGNRIVPFARVGQGFRAPTFYDLYFASQVALEPRPVEPERVVLDAEAGARLALGPLSATGSAFVRQTHDAIVWLPGSFSWSPGNVPRERVRGVEGRLTLGRAAGPLSLEGWGGAYEARATVDGQPVPTPYVPFAAGGAALRGTVRDLSLAVRLDALGRRPYQVTPLGRTTQLPGVALLDVTLSWARDVGASRALVAIGVRDAGDVRWEPVRRFPAPGRSFTASTTFTF